MKENSSRTKKTLVNTISGIINRFGKAILDFILRSVFIYTLGIQYTGVSSVFTDILTMLSLSELGISTAIATALYKPLHDKDNEKMQRLMNFYKSAYRYIAFFIIIIGVILVPFLDKIVTNVPDIKENIKIIFIFYIIKTAFSYLLIYKTTILRADQKQYIIANKELLCFVIRYVIEIVFLILTKNFMIYLIVEIVATIIQNYIITQKAVKQYPEVFEKNNNRLTKTEKKKLFKDIKGLSMYQISATIGNSIDNVLISGFIGTDLVGIVSSYTLIRKQIELILKQFFNAVIPSIGNLAAEENVDKQFMIFNRLFYISFFMVNFCSVSMFVIFNPFITAWLGKNYILSEQIVFVIAFDSFLYILLQAVASFRNANGLFVKGQFRPLCTAVINVILSIVLIKQLGIFGTILATIIARLITQWYDPYILFKSVFNKKFIYFYLKYLSYILIFGISCCITYMVGNIYNAENIILNILYKSICCLIIPNLIVIICTFRTSEFSFVIRTIKDKIKNLKGCH